ncbi:MAG: hypothetical protein A2017_05540 [Lentisphaerae bacterium GWF2_44_16]|nr:MAG: hypothetical protein A2017_05540 [Lentisphaerae bacterium GWF2_44_16]
MERPETRALFDLAEILGHPRPFELEKEISHRDFIWWRVRQDLELTRFHKKYEYYAADLIATVKNMFSSNPNATVETELLKFKAPSDQEEEAFGQMNDDEAFIDAVGQVNKVRGFEK